MPKKIILFILPTILFCQFALFLNITVVNAQSADYKKTETSLFGNLVKPTPPELSVPIGDIKFSSYEREKWIGQYIAAWFHYVVGAIGIIALMMVMWGGILWITSGGNAGQIDKAKGKIKNAVVGVFLLLICYTLFNTINPALLNLTLPTMEPISPKQLCCKDSTSKGTLRYDKCEEGEEEDKTRVACGEKAMEICGGDDTPCGTTHQVKEDYVCMGIKPANGGICVIVMENGSISKAFGMEKQQFVKIVGRENKLVITSKKQCGEVVDDTTGWAGSYCNPDTKKNCWAAFERQAQVSTIGYLEYVYEISLPVCY